MSITKARTNSQPNDPTKGTLYIVLVWGKKRSKEKHFAFYSKDFSMKSLTFDTEFDPVYNWSDANFNLVGKKVTSSYFSQNSFYNTVYKTVSRLSNIFVEYPSFQKSLDKCYDGLLLKVESKPTIKFIINQSK
jgi:hypothetical protein